MEEKTLSLSQYKAYVRNIRNLEVSCYQQELLLRELENKPNDINDEITALERITDEIPTKPLSVVSSVIITVIVSLLASLIGAVIGFICGLLVRIIVGFFVSSLGWLTFLIGGTIIGYIIAFILFLSDLKKQLRKHKMKKAYPEKLKEVERQKQNREEK